MCLPPGGDDYGSARASLQHEFARLMQIQLRGVRQDGGVLEDIIEDEGEDDAF